MRDPSGDTATASGQSSFPGIPTGIEATIVLVTVLITDTPSG